MPRTKQNTAILLGILLLLACICLIPPHRNGSASTPRYKQSTDAPVESTDDFLWPIPGCSHITSLFGYRNIEVYGYERMHTGIDINAGIGTPVIAAESGTVVVSTLDGGYGEYIFINHGDSLITVYGHLDSRVVERGDTVNKGDLIGYSGNTGLSSGPHLHFEVRINGSPISPFRYTYS